MPPYHNDPSPQCRYPNLWVKQPKLVLTLVYYNRIARGLRDTTSCPIERKRCWVWIATAPTPIQAWIDRTACGKRSVVTGIGQRDIRARLRSDPTPCLGNLLVSWESEFQRPAIERAGTRIGDGDIRRKAALPLIY